METTKHTPTPWHVMEGTFGKNRDPKSATIYSCQDDLVYVARCDGSQLMVHEEIDSIADAHFICKAANLFEVLVSSLRDADIMLARASEALRSADEDVRRRFGNDVAGYKGTRTFIRATREKIGTTLMQACEGRSQNEIHDRQPSG